VRELLVSVFGLVGLAGLVAFYIPQLITIWRAPELRGFNLVAWGCLAVAVTGLLVQLVLLGAWTGVAANGVALVVCLETIRQIVKKGR